MLLIPYWLLGAAVSALVCWSAGFSGAMLVVMFLVLTVAFAVGWLLVFVLSWTIGSCFFPLSKDIEKPSRYCLRMVKYITALLCDLSRVSYEIEGEELIPADRRFVLVCNHRSGFDPIITAAALKKTDLAFVCKESVVKKIPVVGPTVHGAGFVGINRDNDREAMRGIFAAADRVKNDQVSFCVYPEGTRNRGEGLLPFRNGSLRLAQRARAPIVIAYVYGTENVAKNYPFHRTKTKLKILRTMSVDEVMSFKTAELGDEIRRCMLCESD